MLAKSSFIVLFAALSLGVSATASAQTEPLLGYRIDYEGITFQVPTSGCTDKASFRLDRTDNVVTLVRTTPDGCFVAVEWGTEVHFPWAEVGVEPSAAVVVANPVSTHGAFRPGPTSWTFGNPLVTTGGVEGLYGYTIGEDGITFQVFSGGCTGPDSFRVDRSGDLLTLVRVEPDYCEAFFEFGHPVTLSPAQLGIEPAALSDVFVANPLVNHVAWTPASPIPLQPASSAVTSISAAASSPTGTPARLSGFLVGGSGLLSLCETLLESMPPRCGDASIPVVGLGAEQVPGGLSAEGDVQWSGWITLSGTVRDGQLADPLVVVD